MWIYVSGPYTVGDTEENVAKAIDLGVKLRDMGHVPIIPHLSHYVHARNPRNYRYWMDWDLELLSRCDAIYRLPGESPGADEEVAFMVARAKPVYTSLEMIPAIFRSS